jgi:penicillin-binding protein 2
VEEQRTLEPVPGSNIYLTIDIGLQEASEKALAEFIYTLNLEREEEKKVPGGAVAVTDVKTGELLAAASYPTFQSATLMENYTEI